MSPVFWSAFYAGLTAPVALFGQTPGYGDLVNSPGAAQSFAAVGAFLGATVPPDDRSRRR